MTATDRDGKRLKDKQTNRHKKIQIGRQTNGELKKERSDEKRKEITLI